MSYAEEWIGVIAAASVPVVLVIPVLGPMLALIALAGVLMLAVTVLVALVGAVAALPVVLTRAVRRRWLGGQELPTYVARAAPRRAS